MEYEVIQINENSWRIEEGEVRFFLLTGSERALLVDSGMFVRNARDIAAALTDLPLSLLNTHADGDHTGSNRQFESFYMHPAEEPNFRRSSKSGTILPIREGDIIDLGSRPLEIIHIPGHTPGSVALLDRVNRVLISGDTIQDGRIFMFGPFRDMETYIQSLDHLEAWKDRFDEIWPSHGTIPVSPDLIGKLREGAKAVMEGNADYHTEEFFDTRVRAFDLGYAAFWCDE